MVAKLYAADVLETAKPVNTEPVVKKEKKPPTEKQLAALKKAQETRKRKREEAAAAKEAEEQAAKQAVEDAAKKLEEAEAKKQARREKAKERRKLKQEAKKEEQINGTAPQLSISGTTQPEAPITPEPSVTEEPKKKKKPRIKKDPAEPPIWFTKFVEGGKLEQNLQAAEKKPKKVVKEEAQVAAKEQWQDNHTRDRVNNELQNHAQRMYSM